MQLSVVELYETAAFDIRAALLGSANRTASSWAPPELEVQQSTELAQLHCPGCARASKFAGDKNWRWALSCRSCKLLHCASVIY